MGWIFRGQSSAKRSSRMRVSRKHASGADLQQANMPDGTRQKQQQRWDSSSSRLLLVIVCIAPSTMAYCPNNSSNLSRREFVPPPCKILSLTENPEVMPNCDWATSRTLMAPSTSGVVSFQRDARSFSNVRAVKFFDILA